jgi:hypothetical protein
LQAGFFKEKRLAFRKDGAGIRLVATNRIPAPSLRISPLFSVSNKRKNDSQYNARDKPF